jgi:Animal haem peroxidase
MFGKPWHKLPTPIALFKLSQFRQKLREKNLHDTSQIPNKEELPQPPKPSPDGSHLTSRTADGSYNDLKHPEMGMAGTRLGRNVPLKEAKVDEKSILTPNPRLVSQKLLQRKDFIPAEILNLHAASWIQFQTHDWFSHGDNQQDNKFSVPLDEADPWRLNYGNFEVAKTFKDPTRDDANIEPATFINKETHWWDASQVYGSNEEIIHCLRSHKDGKMKLGEDGLLPFDKTSGIEYVGFAGGFGSWWLGLSMLHTLFVKEHNTICDHLKQIYPDWNDQKLFDKARLINAALIAKIHTVEWTPAILPHPATAMAMNINWWGILGRDFKKAIGRIGDSETFSGIIGSPTDHHAAPYYLTEEFVSVYRMHPLIPDELEFYSHRDGKLLTKKNFPEVFGKKTRPFVEEVGMEDLFYSFGNTHPGMVTLHNYPNFLRALVKDNGEVFDLAAIDILRDRERGVPRYNRFREIVGRGRVKTFEEITDNAQIVKELREVYNNDIDSIDLMVGLFAEKVPEGFGFSDTAFRVFILMASRRLKSDRFFTSDYRAEVYTQFGLDWIEQSSMISVICRHYPELTRHLRRTDNAFKPWTPKQA